MFLPRHFMAEAWKIQPKHHLGASLGPPHGLKTSTVSAPHVSVMGTQLEGETRGTAQELSQQGGCFRRTRVPETQGLFTSLACVSTGAPGHVRPSSPTQSGTCLSRSLVPSPGNPCQHRQPGQALFPPSARNS